MGENLTLKQMRLCDEYLIDFNIKEASKRAGYSYSSAKRILKMPKAQEYIRKKQEDISSKLNITAQKVIEEYAKLAFFDIRNIFNPDGSPKPINELDSSVSAAISSVEVVELYEGRGENKRFVGYNKKYKIADKKAALDSICKHLGLFKENETKNEDVTEIEFVDDYGADEGDGDEKDNQGIVEWKF